MCGGTRAGVAIRHGYGGLSPRVRGNHLTYAHEKRFQRSIPACAGEPREPAHHRGSARVYPRVCGGTPSAPLRGCLLAGLSPRVRGNQGRQRREAGLPRSIPACAGEPGAYGLGGAGLEVYPRVCGGTYVCLHENFLELGLSPRVRGNPPWSVGAPPHPGSIPACAGEPSGLPGTRIQSEVYPRVCGGTHPGRWARPLIRGLSPRVRGNPVGCREHESSRRSIPACAGEPLVVSGPHRGGTVYPRVCGGTLVNPAHERNFGGLSPRVRGNRHSASSAHTAARSIPACAGEPQTCCLWYPSDTVYPRVCGGTRNVKDAGCARSGLSPRVRGNRSLPCALCQRMGSIPACAGEPANDLRPPGAIRVYPRVCGGTSIYY